MLGWRAGAVGWLGFIGLVGLWVGFTAGDPAPAFAGTCGDPGQPACPLQSFMRSKVAAPLAQKDMAQLASNLDRVSAVPPDASWSTWSTFAKQGADAARKNDVPGTRAACKGCHDAWREKYRKDFRTRPSP